MGKEIEKPIINKKQLNISIHQMNNITKLNRKEKKKN